MLEMLSKEKVFLVVIDPQEKLMNAINDKENVIKKMKLMTESAKVLDIPIVPTTQYKKGIGEIIPELADELLPLEPIDKLEFNCFDNSSFIERISRLNDKSKYALIIGVETHICVYQTALGARFHGFNPIIVLDATSSRNPIDKEIATKRFMQLDFQIASSEMVIYEILKSAGSEKFKEILKLVVKYS